MSGIDETLMAYVDGELDAAARAAFEQRLVQDPTLRQALAREQRLRETLGRAYAPVLQEPVPERLSALLKPSATVVSLDSMRAQRRLGWIQWGGMAASLVLGLVLGPKLLGDFNQDGLLARGTLAQALDTRLSGESAGGVTPGLSFVAQGGGYCRSFTQGGSAGLACREGDHWRLRQLQPLPAASPDAAAYRSAATALPPALLEAIDGLRQGDALDAEAERRARERGWQAGP
ncbi:anti-sigma factor family protein [Roseateles violae]|uniref:Anti-sigma factor n=1 Tax=Roseateles violae TaxID=3058042 RepID=A0ABT8DYY4_9BURK|nr:hypothetical protein [Pelomonas sp. PFR6]MDN3922790.1 hypothetical protein [Pelomonas sp. PFR6]